ncbi:hypothetical protein [Staphylospora marina]|uniref:hypothetical protein n=1 Tax=Staphylospora marina TaxID=2490858 RepID=UPI000F5B895B|nr:hypothetical protein [Staphylospora marina]
MEEVRRHIVVGVIRSGEWQWYVTEKELWVMDYPKWAQAYVDSEFEHMAPDAEVDRFGIPVLDEETVDLFLEYVREQQINGEELTLWMEEALASGWQDLSGWEPSLLIDFDRQVLISRHPERHFFERYVPDRWIGEYCDFLEQVPEEERYWTRVRTDRPSEDGEDGETEFLVMAGEDDGGAEL